MVMMVFVPHRGCRIPVHRLIYQGLIGIATICWVSCWLGLIGVPIIRRGIEVPQCVGQKYSGSWKSSQPFLQHFSDVCVVAPVGTVYLNLQYISWGRLKLHYPWCGDLVLILVFLTCYEFSLYNLGCRDLFCSWVVWWEYCWHHSGRPPRFNYYLCLIAL